MEGSGILNLLANVPPGIFNKVAQLASTSQFFTDQIQLEVLFGENVDRVREGVDNLGGTFENLGYGFGIITLPVDKLRDISTIQGIQYLEVPKLVYTSSIESLRPSCVPEVWSAANLTGRGVLVGFIDTGIDYRNNAFRNPDGTTRIEFLYDLVAGGQYYSREQINQALQSTNPLSVVNFTDSTGHGTSVAGIACAGGNIDRNFYGAAFESSIAMVKITGAEGVNFSLSSQVMRAIRFLTERAREINLPLVINLSWSTNDGAHNGSSILEQYVSTISSEELVTMVIAAGNEGDTGRHVGGELQPQQNIQFQVAPRELGLVLQLYAPVLSELSIEVTNPLGRRTGSIPLLEGYRQASLDGDLVLNYNTGPKPFSIEGEVIISIVSALEQSITSGQWTITISNQSPYGGRYDIWMPISANLQATTRFLNPDVFNTLGIPATVENVVSVGSYNYNTLSISSFSGRGIFGRGFIKPDLTAPGENIVTTLATGGFGARSGTSMAAPQVSGICALFMQWGIVLGNDPFLYGDRLKYYLVRTATRRLLEEGYPNPTWGYGRICARDAYNLLRTVIPSVTRQEQQPIAAPGQQQPAIPVQPQATTPTQQQATPSTQQGATPPGQPTTPGQQQPAIPVQPQATTPTQQQTTPPTQQGTATPSQPTTPGQQQPAIPVQPQAPTPQTPQQSELLAQQGVATPGQASLEVPPPPPVEMVPGAQLESQIKANYLSPDYTNYIAQYGGNVVEDVAATGLGTAFIFDDKYAIVSVLRGRRAELLERTNSIVFLDSGRIYILNQVNPLDSAGVTQVQNNPFLNLTGRGVLLGLIDTGIDYMNPEFIFENNTSKVVRLWDQTIQTGQPPEGYVFGTEYREEEINQAIALANQGGDPYSVVPSRDEAGHGTHMAGIMGARGVDPAIVGAAPDSRFVVVKLKPSKLAQIEELVNPELGVTLYGDTDILLALKYVYLTARELGAPISILLPLSTNFGPHDGSQIIEKYINYMVDFPGVSVTVPIGNEGFSDTHAEGTIVQGGTSTLELQIGEGERNMIMEIWFQNPDRAAIGLVSPSGEVVDRLPIRNGITQRVTLLYERTNVSVIYNSPNPTNGDESIDVLLLNVVPGIWRFTLYGERILNGTYNAWIPSRELLQQNTRFLNPSQDITLTPPSTSAGAISPGYYNQNNNTAVVYSGRGFTRTGAIKPDFVAGGVNAVTTAVGGGTTTVTGSSVGGAVTAGAVALLIQWGVINNRDISFYNQVIKSYLIAGATRQQGEIYPSKQLGYGQLSLTGVFESIRNVYRNSGDFEELMHFVNLKDITKEESFSIGEMYIKAPGNYYY